ncbi:hypothetical protein [Cellulosimicrobium sp. SL-1]|uniref:hypothetical protein n=1 Tax=Cellulosimicrobium sp. SL-1 TaxID=2699423 RepID=UPI0013D09240|nr:hypothetical protein [Cellulosimicrobium sp. SL-1]
MPTPQQAIATCTAHSWIETTTYDDARRVYACTACPETTTGCQDCDRPLVATALLICKRCLARAYGLLDDIATYLAEMTDVAKVAVGLRAVRYDLTGTSSAVNTDRLPHGLDPAYREDAFRSGPSSIRTQDGALDLLEAWVDDWSEKVGDTEGAWDTLEYLRSHTVWAAQNHPAWPTYLDELRATRAVVRRLAGLAPEREAAPCFHCGGAIVRDWHVAEGLSDVVRCTSCRRSWASEAHLALAARWHVHALPHERPETLVTAEQARTIFPDLNPSTWRSWMRRDREMPVPFAQRIPVRGFDARGRELFAVADIATRVEASRT